jgi:hypothetical protein
MRAHGMMKQRQHAVSAAVGASVANRTSGAASDHITLCREPIHTGGPGAICVMFYRPRRSGARAYSRSHRRAGIGACCRTITQARLRRLPNSASNSARPTVTVRPFGSGTAPPAASTAATRSRSAVRYASTSDSISRTRTTALREPKVKEIATVQSQKPVLNRINSPKDWHSSVADQLLRDARIGGYDPALGSNLTFYPADVHCPSCYCSRHIVRFDERRSMNAFVVSGLIKRGERQSGAGWPSRGHFEGEPTR